MVFRTMYDV